MVLMLGVGKQVDAGSGSLGARALNKLRPTGLLHKVTNYGNGALARGALAAGLVTTLICGGISGCDESEPDVYDAASVYSSIYIVDDYTGITYDIIGQRVYFEYGDSVQFGYVVEAASSHEVVILPDSGAGTAFERSSRMVVDVDAIPAIEVEHEDTHAMVLLLGDASFGEESYEGKVFAVYSDGYRRIQVRRIYYMDGSYEDLYVNSDEHSPPFFVLVHGDTSYEDGGYVFLAID